jgi:hypothetical protein
VKKLNGTFINTICRWINIWFTFRYEEIEEIIKKTKHAMRIRDIGLVYECQWLFLIDRLDFSYGFFFIGYENLIKAFEKARRVLEKDQGTMKIFSYLF